MPCYTKVSVSLEDNKWNRLAREKLGMNATGEVTEEEARQVKLEASKLKTHAAIKVMNPTANITGMTIGSKKMTIQVNL